MVNFKEIPIVPMLGFHEIRNDIVYNIELYEFEAREIESKFGKGIYLPVLLNGKEGLLRINNQSLLAILQTKELNKPFSVKRTGSGFNTIYTIVE